MPILTLNATADSYVDGQTAYQSINYGTQAELKFRAVGWGKQELFLLFNLSQITSAYTINSVQLQLYQTVWGANRTMRIYRAGGAWTENGVTWANAPGVTGNLMGSLNLTSTVSAYLQSEALNITEFWTLVGANNGLRVTAITDEDTGSNSNVFSSREGGYAPRLVIDYTIKSQQMQIAGAIGL